MTTRGFSRRWALLLAMTAALTITVDARAESVRELVRQADRALRGTTSAAVVRMDIKTKSYQRSYDIVIWDDSRGKRDKTLVKVLGPTLWRGFATLKVGTRLLFYDPKTNHVQNVSSSMLGDSWMGSHFTNDDLVKETQLADHYDPKLSKKWKGKGENGKPATYYRVQLLPKATAPVAWGRIVYDLYRQGETIVFVRALYYRKARDEKAARTLRAYGVREMGGRTVPTRLKVTVANKPGEYTLITYKKLRFDVKIPASKFTEQAMR